MVKMRHQSGVTVEDGEIRYQRDDMRQETLVNVEMTVSIPDELVRGTATMPNRPLEKMLEGLMDVVACEVARHLQQPEDVYTSYDRALETFSPLPHRDFTVYDEEAKITLEQWNKLKHLELPESMTDGLERLIRKQEDQ